MINLTEDEFLEIVAETIKEFVKAVEDDALVPILLTLCATIGAKAEIKTEKKEAKTKKEELEAFIEYDAGKWNITIAAMSYDNVRLTIKRNGIVAVDRVLDSLYKAYNYAFNIICL